MYIEDSTWALHAAYMCSLSARRWPTGTLFFGVFAVYMYTCHLPKRFRLMFSRGSTSLLRVEPLLGLSFWATSSSGGRVRIQPCDSEEKAWVVPMLVGQAVATSFMFYQMNS